MPKFAKGSCRIRTFAHSMSCQILKDKNGHSSSNGIGPAYFFASRKMLYLQYKFEQKWVLDYKTIVCVYLFKK